MELRARFALGKRRSLEGAGWAATDVYLRTRTHRSGYEKPTIREKEKICTYGSTWPYNS